MNEFGDNTHGGGANGTSHHESSQDKKPQNGGTDENGAWNLGEGARATASALRDAYRGASATVSDLSGEAYQIGTKTSAQIARTVESQPMTAVLIAASLGLVAGILLSRR